VDVSDKPVTARTAIAEGYLVLSPATLALLESGSGAKGDALGVARVAGIMAAKRTHDLIPLCHPLALTKVAVDFELQQDAQRVRVEAMARLSGQTGVEMEALTAVSVACLTLYDMLKAADKAMRIEGIRLLEKSGGKSGSYRAGQAAGGGGQ
jgi:cyclic pyranopterin phosphate synthase